MNQIAYAFLFAAMTAGSIPHQLKTMVDQGLFAEAYQLGLEWQEDYEGAPDYDLYWSIAAIEVGRFPEAVLALERVLMFDPQNHRARLELGRAHYLLGDLIQSKLAFDTVMASSPPEGVQNRIQKFLEAIEARDKSLDMNSLWIFEFDGGYSSNINSATSSESTEIIVPIGQPFILTEESQKQDSAYSHFKAVWNLAKPLTKHKLIYSTLDYDNLYSFSNSDFNIDALSLGGGYRASTGFGQLRIPTNLQVVAVGGSYAQSTFSLGFDLTKPMSAQWDWLTYGQAGLTRYEKESKVRDVDSVVIGTGFSYRMRSRPFQFSGSVQAGEFKAKESDIFGYSLWGIRLSGEYRPADTHTIFLNAAYQSSDYDAKSIFPEIREDDAVDSVLGWRWQLSKQSTITSNIAYVDNRSTQTIYDFDRFKAQVGIRYMLD